MTDNAVVGRLTEADCRLDDLLEVLAARTDPADYPNAQGVVEEVLVYDSAQLRRAPQAEVSAELVRALTDGPGIVVFRGAFADRGVVDRATAAFEQLIAEQRASAPSPVITSPRQGPTTGCGTLWRSSPWPRRRCSSPTMPTTSSRSSRGPGSAPATR